MTVLRSTRRHGPLCNQALSSLKAELAFRRRQLESGVPKTRVTVQQILQYWKVDRNLAGVRDPERLARLSDEEQRSWKTLWAEADALLQKALGDRP